MYYNKCRSNEIYLFKILKLITEELKREEVNYDD